MLADDSNLSRNDRMAADLQAVAFVTAAIVKHLGTPDLPLTSNQDIMDAIDERHDDKSPVWRAEFAALVTQRIQSIISQP